MSVSDEVTLKKALPLVTGNSRVGVLVVVFVVDVVEPLAAGRLLTVLPPSVMGALVARGAFSNGVFSIVEVSAPLSTATLSSPQSSPSSSLVSFWLVWLA